MAGTIYTPVSLWEGFSLELPMEEELVREYEKDGVIFREIYFDGRKTAAGRVKIYALAAFEKKNARMPGLLILPSYTKTPDENTALYFARKGYYALMVDYSGNFRSPERYTVYPEDVSYANATEDRDAIHRVEKDAKHTCWYEWSAVAQYAGYYLKTRGEVSGYGALGVKHGATILWQLATLDKDLKCFAAVFSAGWRAYRGCFKFGEHSEPELDDEMYKYLAAIEPQAYAQYVKCPVLMLSCTNNRYFDVDRAFDTVARIDPSVKAYLNYAPQRAKTLDTRCKADLELFLEKFLKGAEVDLPEEPELSCELNNGSIFVKVQADGKGLSDICLYAAEETVNPALRCWNFKAEAVGKTEGSALFKYTPYKYSGQAMFFAQARYENGAAVCSRVLAKKFAPEEIQNENKSNIVFSARENKYLMCPKDETAAAGPLNWLQTEEHDYIEILTGAFEIEGVTSAGGIATFKINNAADRPSVSSILLADVYAPAGAKLTVKLIADLYGADKKEYFVTAEIAGGEVWHKLSFPVSKFKTEDGMILKSMDKINMIAFECGGKYLLNNILWV